VRSICLSEHFRVYTTGNLTNIITLQCECVQCGKLVGGGRVKWGKLASYKWNYNEVARCIVRVCGDRLPVVYTSSSPGGLWSKVLQAMGRPDSRKMRQKLQTMWTENRGKIRVSFNVPDNRKLSISDCNRVFTKSKKPCYSNYTVTVENPKMCGFWQHP